MIALYCLIKSNTTNRNDDWMMIGIDQLDLRVFKIISREGLSLHVASYDRKFPRKDRKKHRRVTAGHRQCSSQVEVNCRQQLYRSSGFARPTEPSMWSVSLEGELCWQWVLGSQLGRRCHDTQTISSWMFKKNQKNRMGCRIFPQKYFRI